MNRWRLVSATGGETSISMLAGIDETGALTALFMCAKNGRRHLHPLSGFGQARRMNCFVLVANGSATPFAQNNRCANVKLSSVSKFSSPIPNHISAALTSFCAICVYEFAGDVFAGIQSRVCATSIVQSARTCCHRLDLVNFLTANEREPR